MDGIAKALNVAKTAIPSGPIHVFKTFTFHARANALLRPLFRSSSETNT
jgi:hypothetical protein